MSDRLRPGERAFVVVFSIVVLGATLAPLARHPDDDSFPFSTYPMFSHARPRELSMVHALGLTGGGAREPLPPMISAANREVLQSMATLGQAVSAGRAEAQCEEIAARVASDPSRAHLVAVEIATDTFDAVAYFEEDDTAPRARDVHATCAVPRDEAHDEQREERDDGSLGAGPAAPALRIATLRVLVGGYGLVYLALRLSHLMSYALDDLGRFAPVGVVTLAPAPTLPWLYRVLVLSLLPTSLAFFLGYRHRVLAPLHAVLLFWVLSYSNSWGKILHTDNLFLLHVVVLAFAPAADSLSIDARGRSAPPAHVRYGWAPRLMVAVAAAAYLLAGIAKLRNNGLDFAMGETLRNFVAFDNARKIELGSFHSPLGAALVPYPALFSVLAWGSLALELGAPLALSPRIGRWWAIAMWSFHVGVLALMAIGFVYPLSFVAFAPLFAVEKLWSLRPLRAWAQRFGAVPDPGSTRA